MLNTILTRNPEWFIVRSGPDGMVITSPSETPRLYYAVYLYPEEVISLGETGVIESITDNSGNTVTIGDEFLSRLTNLTGGIIRIRR